MFDVMFIKFDGNYIYFFEFAYHQFAPDICLEFNRNFSSNLFFHIVASLDLRAPEREAGSGGQGKMCAGSGAKG